MSIENILFNIGYGLPFVLLLGVVSGLGWWLRREIGLAIGGGIVAAIFNFGTLMSQAGEAATQRQAAIAAGASAIAAVLAFSIVYLGSRQVRRETAKYEKSIAAMGMFALTVAGALGAMVVALVLTGSPYLSGYTESLMIYSLLLGGLTYAAIEWSKDKVTNAGEASPKP